MANRISMNFDAQKFDKSLSQYSERVRGALRPAAHAGVQVLYDEMRTRAHVGDKPFRVRGKTYEPGTLRDAIYQVFSEDNSDMDRKTYQVGPNKKKAGWWAWVEFGHWGRGYGKGARFWVPAMPYIRPTWDARGHDAVAAMRARLREVLAKGNPS